MNVGIHFSNKLWNSPSEEDFRRLRLARPECIKTLLFDRNLFGQVHTWDQIGVHRRLRQEHPDALIVARLYADMGGGPWRPDEFADRFFAPIEALRDVTVWFEVHNEPNLDPASGVNEGFGPTDADFSRFSDWIAQVLPLLRRDHPWAKWVFPGNAIHRYPEFWRALLPQIRHFDAWGVHCYWQFSNHTDPFFGRCYEAAHALLPEMPIIITECGDSTNGRSPRDKIPLYREWFAEADRQPYILGTALYILGGTQDWITHPDRPNFDVTEEVAGALGTLPRQPKGPLPADGFDFPVGDADGHGFYVSAELVDPRYWADYGRWHTGEDWTPVAEGEVQVVRAAAHGQVITAQNFADWGGLVLIEHRLSDGRTVWSQYAHLEGLMVRKGDVVVRGQPLGTLPAVGPEGGKPHLHFEVRMRRLPASKRDWVAEEDRDAVIRAYAHPSQFVRLHRPGAALVSILVDRDDPGFQRSASPYWHDDQGSERGLVWWTWTVSEDQGEDCVATWTPEIEEEGLYEVFAFVPRRYATTRHARYQVTHRRGVDTVEVSQNDYYDEWVSLGTYAFSTLLTAQVRLSDVTGEPYTRDEATRRRVAYGPVIWVRTEAPPETYVPAPEGIALPELGAPVWPLAVDGFDYPVGAPNGAGYYIAAGVAEDDYRRLFGAWHTGEDWNDLRGGDSDLGAPIYAIAHGRVVTAGTFSGWGHILLIEHLLDGQDGEADVWSQYAHCREMLVGEGDVVLRGQQIATIGKGAGDRYPAHLHFEVRKSLMPADQWGWRTDAQREQLLAAYYHPSDFIDSHRPEGALPAVLVDAGDAGFWRSDSRYWFEQDAGHGGRSFWTWTVSAEQGEDCVATWTPTLPEAGRYQVFAYVPASSAATRQARYQVTHAQGATAVTINQGDHPDQWISLGVFSFVPEGPGMVRLSDLTGEPYTRDEATRRQIAYDAMLWVPVGG